MGGRSSGTAISSLHICNSSSLPYRYSANLNWSFFPRGVVGVAVEGNFVGDERSGFDSDSFPLDSVLSLRLKMEAKTIGGWLQYAWHKVHEYTGLQKGLCTHHKSMAVTQVLMWTCLRQDCLMLKLIPHIVGNIDGFFKITKFKPAQV